MDSEVLIGEVLRQLVTKKARADSRDISSSRPNKCVETGLVARAWGSCMLSHGSTLVTCAITGELSPTLASAPNQGYCDIDLVYNAATCFSILRSESATLQPSDDNRDLSWQAEATSFLQEAFLPSSSSCSSTNSSSTSANVTSASSSSSSSGTNKTNNSNNRSDIIDLESLVISEGEACWAVKISCVIMQDDGGVLEACSAAIKHALLNVKFPTEFTLPDGVNKQPWSPPEGHSSFALPSFVSSFKQQQNQNQTGQQQQQQQQEEQLKISTIGFLHTKNSTAVSPSEEEPEEVLVVMDPTAAEAAAMDNCMSVALHSSNKNNNNNNNSKKNSKNCFVLHGGKPIASNVITHILDFARSN